MTDTTGWKHGENCDYMKDIDGVRYEINRGRDNKFWWLWCDNTIIGTYATKRAAQIAAHDHARSKE